GGGMFLPRNRDETFALLQGAPGPLTCRIGMNLGGRYAFDPTDHCGPPASHQAPQFGGPNRPNSILIFLRWHRHDRDPMIGGPWMKRREGAADGASWIGPAGIDGNRGSADRHRLAGGGPRT